MVETGISWADVEAMPTDERLALLTLLIERKQGGDGEGRGDDIRTALGGI